MKVQSSTFVVVPFNAMTASRTGFHISERDRWQMHTFTSQQMSRMMQTVYNLIMKSDQITGEDYTLAGRIEQLWAKNPELITGGTST